MSASGETLQACLRLYGEQLPRMLSIGPDFLPYVDDAKGLAEVFTGRDLITGEV